MIEATEHTFDPKVDLKNILRIEACIRTAKRNVRMHTIWVDNGTAGPGSLATAQRALERLQDRYRAATALRKRNKQ